MILDMTHIGVDHHAALLGSDTAQFGGTLGAGGDLCCEIGDILLGPARDYCRICNRCVFRKCPISKQLQFKSHSTTLPAPFLQTPLSKAPDGADVLRAFVPGRFR